MQPCNGSVGRDDTSIPKMSSGFPGVRAGSWSLRDVLLALMLSLSACVRARTARYCVLVSSVVCDRFVAAAGLLGCIRVVGVRSPTEYLRTYLDLYASVSIAVSCWRSDWVGIKRGVKKRSCYHPLNNCDQIQTQTACRAGEPNPKSTQNDLKTG